MCHSGFANVVTYIHVFVCCHIPPGLKQPEGGRESSNINLAVFVILQ